MTYRLSARAEADLFDIWIYSAERWGLDQADRYIDALLTRLVWISGNPSQWKARPEITEGLYSTAQQSHVIYFRKASQRATTVEIVRVLHGRMDPSEHL